MAWFSKTPEEIAEREKAKLAKAELQEAQRLDVEKRLAEERFAQTPAGHAKAARDSGSRIFQLALPLSKTTGYTRAMTGAYARTATEEHASTLDSIEAQGWRLENAGYVYRVIGSVSRDKFLSSGQQEAMHGEIVGVYIFRATD